MSRHATQPSYEDPVQEHPALALAVRHVVLTGHRVLLVRAERDAVFTLAVALTALLVFVPGWAALELFTPYGIHPLAGLALLVALVFTDGCLLMRLPAIRAFLRRKYCTPQRQWYRGVAEIGGIGALPAVLLTSTDAFVVRFLEHHVAPHRLSDADRDVIATLIRDGFRGTLDEMLTITKGLR